MTAAQLLAVFESAENSPQEAFLLWLMEQEQQQVQNREEEGDGEHGNDKRCLLDENNTDVRPSAMAQRKQHHHTFIVNNKHRCRSCRAENVFSRSSRKQNQRAKTELCIFVINDISN